MTGGVPERLASFVKALRAQGIPAGPAETVDAAAALEVLGMDDRALVREGLAAALVRRGGQRAVFDAAFDLYFPAGIGTPERAREEPSTLEELREELAAALADGDEQALAQLAGLAVDLLGQYGSASGPGGGFSAHQTLERLQPQTLIARVLAAVRGGGARGEFTDRLDRDEIRR
ncbi:hypothetical protein GTY80_26180, partial [Amycolatopsis sp. SID8362]|nr:hypothetical protein [Amycolatopsis sp. SID8362]NED43411.1 hypothetical protein [Amycolatopsis sp. SID8362]